MQELKQALKEVQGLHQKILGHAAPELGPQDYFPFPAGVDPLRHALWEVEQLGQISERAAFAPRVGAWLPPADSFATPDEFIVCIELPSVSREDLKVFVLGGECIVRGERKPPVHLTKARPLGLERPWGPFERRFVIPVGSHVDRMTAKVSGGLLEIRIPMDAANVPQQQKVEVE